MPVKRTPRHRAKLTESESIKRIYQAYDADRVVVRRRTRPGAGGRAIGEELHDRLQLELSRIDFPNGGGVLDVGCGRGGFLALIASILSHKEPRLYGVDVLRNRVEEARSRVPSACILLQSAESLPFPDASFHLLLAATLFSSILDDEIAGQVASEMWRVLRPGGYILGYDMRYPNPFNHNVRPSGGRRWRQLFPEGRVEVASMTLIPQLARRLGGLTDDLYPLLVRIPPLRSHVFVRLARV